MTLLLAGVVVGQGMRRLIFTTFALLTLALAAPAQASSRCHHDGYGGCPTPTPTVTATVAPTPTVSPTATDTFSRPPQPTQVATYRPRLPQTGSPTGPIFLFGLALFITGAAAIAISKFRRQP